MLRVEALWLQQQVGGPGWRAPGMRFRSSAFPCCSSHPSTDGAAESLHTDLPAPSAGPHALRVLCLAAGQRRRRALGPQRLLPPAQGAGGAAAAQGGHPRVSGLAPGGGSGLACRQSGGTWACERIAPLPCTLLLRHPALLTLWHSRTHMCSHGVHVLLKALKLGSPPEAVYIAEQVRQGACLLRWRLPRLDTCIDCLTPAQYTAGRRSHPANLYQPASPLLCPCSASPAGGAPPGRLCVGQGGILCRLQSGREAGEPGEGWWG